MLVGAVAIPRTAVGVAEYTDVIDGSAAQLDRFVECLDGTGVLTALCAGVPQRIVPKCKGRFEFDNPLELRNRAIEIVTETVDVTNLRLDLKIKRIEPFGLFQLDQGQIVTRLEQRESPGVPQMRGG